MQWRENDDNFSTNFEESEISANEPAASPDLITEPVHKVGDATAHRHVPGNSIIFEHLFKFKVIYGTRHTVC